jgi:O-antigen/teichoic acid export membrane protein
MLLASLNANVPRYMIEQLLDTHALGIFGALSYLMVAGTTIIAALGQVVSPRLARYYAERDLRKYWNLVARMLGLASAIGIVGVMIAIAVGAFLLRLIYQPEYAEHHDFIFAACLGVVWIGCALLVPYYGMMGAAIVMGLQSLLQASLTFTWLYWVQRRAKFEFAGSRT